MDSDCVMGTALRCGMNALLLSGMNEIKEGERMKFDLAALSALTRNDVSSSDHHHRFNALNSTQLAQSHLKIARKTSR